jgi:DNA-directed RNA polymerase specialized sigma24 family protein
MIDATVSRAKAGDVDAINTVLSNLGTYIRHHITSQIGQHSDVDDLSQEVLIKVYRRLPTCRAETMSQFYSWVSAICRTTCLDFHKSAVSKPIKLLGAYDTAVSGDVFLAMEAQEIIYVAAERSGSVQEVQLAVDGMSYNEIGSRLGIGKRLVQAKLDRHRRSVRAIVSSISG